MKEISLSDVKEVFSNILNGNMSREEADRWAYCLVKESEKNNLIFCPLEKQEAIWKGIMYLYGIDIKDSPTEYLHTTNDIELTFEKILSL